MTQFRKPVIFFVIVLIFLGLFFRYLVRAPKRHWCDFRVYYKTGERFVARENIYARPDQSLTPYKYSPFFAMLMAPLSLFPIGKAALIFFTLNFVLLVGVFALSHRLIVRNQTPFRQSVFLCVFSAIFSFRFILHALDSGQVGIILFFLVLLGVYFLREKKDSIGAGFIALAAMIKYTPLIFLPYLFFKKRIKAGFLIVVFIVILSFLPSVHVGLEKGVAYLKNWLPFISTTSFDKPSMYDYKNQSIFAFVLRHFTGASPYNISLAPLPFGYGILIALVLGAVTFALIVYPTGKSGELAGSPDLCLLFISMVLFNPNAWMHNFAVFIFIYMAAFYYLAKTGFKDKFTLLAVVLSFALTTLTSELFVGDALERVLETFSCVTVGTLILMGLFFRLKYGFPLSRE